MLTGNTASDEENRCIGGADDKEQQRGDPQGVDG